MSVDIVNRQRKFKVNATGLQARAEQVLESLGRGGSEVSILLVNDPRMRAFNTEYRGKAKSTDVLSFSLLESGGEDWQPTHGHLGDIILSVETALRQARDRDGELGGVGYGLEEELTFLMVHGVLHLLGFDHMTGEDAQVMEEKERELFSAFSPHLAREQHGRREAK